MRFTIIFFFILIIGVESARAQIGRSLAPQIAKVTRIITALKLKNDPTDSARISFFEKILAGMKLTQSNLDQGAPKPKARVNPGARWTGTMTMEVISIFSNPVYNGKTEKKIQVSFVNALPTTFRNDQDNDSPYKNNEEDTLFADNKGSGTHQVHGDVVESFSNRRCVSDCQGGSISELYSVIVREWDNTYDIEAIGPFCNMTGNCIDPQENHDAVVSALNKPLTDKNVLAGTETVTGEMPGGMGTFTRTTTWHLERTISEDELIVTPWKYDDWLPKPGKNENDAGAFMLVNLQVVGKNGNPPTLKVKSFELRLKNTSREPGICLNMPLIAGPILPDIRFDDKDPFAQTSGDRQVTTVECLDGTTGFTSLLSYDGGGYTTLTATATMEDGSKLEGHLLISGGKKEIPIPKRPAGSNIAEAWLTKYNNPRDADDIETSPGNKNDGDGLSAYEEYRGFIAEGSFVRLNPNKKEVGIKTSDEQLFFGGLVKFEKSSGVIVVPFYENEIGADRRLNKNKKTTHIYDQYVIHLKQGSLTGALGNSVGGPGIPKQVSSTIIDKNRIHLSYLERVAEAQSINQTLSYSEKDLFATITAHELAHSVGVKHHGSQAPNSLNLNVTPDRTTVRIFNYQGIELPKPQRIAGRVGDTGNEQSGNVSCFMLNNALCDWAVKSTPDSMFFYEVPLIPLGTRLCSDKIGTGLNSIRDAHGNYKYFGDAVNGNCLSQIKLK